MFFLTKCELNNEWRLFSCCRTFLSICHLQVDLLHVLHQSQLITCSNRTSNLNQFQPPSASLSCFDLCLQMHIQHCTIRVSNFPWSWLSTVWADWLDYSLQMNLWVDSIPVYKSVPNLACLQPPTLSPSLHINSVLKWWSSDGIQGNFVKKRGFCSRSIGRGWENIKRYISKNHNRVPTMDPRQWVFPTFLANNLSDLMAFFHHALKPSIMYIIRTFEQLMLSFKINCLRSVTLVL
jgi:hypothetical protein